MCFSGGFQFHLVVRFVVDIVAVLRLVYVESKFDRTMEGVFDNPRLSSCLLDHVRRL